MARLVTFVRLPWARKTLFFRACYELLRARTIVRKKRFDQYSHLIGQKHPGDHIHAEMAVSQPVRDVRWAVNAASKAMGGGFSCLMIALAGKSLLNRSEISNALVVGASPGEPDEEMAAHAWLRVGDAVVFGEEERRKFSPLLSFVDTFH